MIIEVRFNNGMSTMFCDSASLDNAASKASAEQAKFWPPEEIDHLPQPTIVRQMDQNVCALCGRSDENESATIDIAVTSGNDLKICRSCAAHVHRSLVDQHFAHEQGL